MLGKIGYKVVKRKSKNVFMPCTSMALQKIKYKIGYETVQKEDDYGAFAVFENYEDARTFASSDDNILLVRYIKSNEDILWKKNPPIFRRGYGNSYYAESNGITERHITDCPKGTVLAKLVYPIEIIK